MESNLFSALSRYLQDTTNPDDYSHTSLMYEGMRLKTFHCISIATSPIRLAAAGFYATSNGDETKCYSCGVTYRGWRSTDNPLLIHRQISSDCRLITDTVTDNVPRDELRFIQFQCFNIPQSLTDYGRAGRHSNQDVNPSELVSQRSQVVAAPAATPMSACALALVPTSRLTLKAEKDCRPADTLSPLFVPRTGRYEGFNSLTSLHFEGAVHPHYSELGERLKSFVTWPFGHCKKPEDLATAGFFYAGYADSVRCFVCGIGLRTWEKEDDPWTEHVRWRSSCDYVKVVKGQDFVIQALTAIGRENRNITNNDGSRRNQPSPQAVAFDIMKTVECHRALEMGFDHQRIRQIATEITGGEGRQKLTLDVLIERLVMDEDITGSETPSLQTSASTPAPPHQTLSTSNCCTNSDHGESGDEGRCSGHSESGNYPTYLSQNAADARSEDKQQKSGQLRVSQTTSEGSSDVMGVGDALNPSHKSLPVVGTSRNIHNGTAKKSGSLPSHAQTTEEENRELKESSLCKVCLDDQANIVFLPCGHLVTCATCSPALDRCPVCRKHIRGTVRVHMANKASVQNDL